MRGLHSFDLGSNLRTLLDIAVATFALSTPFHERLTVKYPPGSAALQFFVQHVGAAF